MTKEEAIKILYEIIDEGWLISDNNKCSAINACEMAIRALELIGIGYWVATENEDMEIVGYYCSRCDMPMETDEKTNYCPNCGARMLEPIGK